VRLHILARGKIGRGPEAELVARYAARMTWPMQLTELADTAPFPPAAGVVTVALDERGQAWRSVEFAQRLGAWRDEGARECRFLLGAADGLSDAERDGADHRLSFGPATWPHLLARAMLAEQLYRATAILVGHPYHREG